MPNKQRDFPYDVPELIEMIRSENQETQIRAARRVWTDWEILPNQEKLIEIAPVLLDLLQTKEEKAEENREIWHSMLALGSMQYKPALDIIVTKLLESEADNIRGFAADALARYSRDKISNEVLVKIWQVLEKDEILVVKVNLLRALQKFFKGTKNDQVAQNLMSIIGEQDHPVITSTIIKVIGLIGSKEVTPNLIHLMVARRTELDINAASNALDRIAKLNGFENRKELMDKYGFTADDLE